MKKKYRVVQAPEGNILGEYDTEELARRARLQLCTSFKLRYSFRDLMIEVVNAAEK